MNLAISTTKLTARTVISAAQMYLKHRKEVKTQKAQEKPTGKQTVKELIGQGDGVTNIDISKTDLKGFESVARKYGIDYAIRKDGSVHPPKYLVFFKAKDTDALGLFAALDAAAAKDALGGVTDDARSDFVFVDLGLGAFEGAWASSDDGSDLIEFAVSILDAGLAILVMVGKNKFDAGAAGFNCHWG